MSRQDTKAVPAALGALRSKNTITTIRPALYIMYRSPSLQIELWLSDLDLRARM